MSDSNRGGFGEAVDSNPVDSRDEQKPTANDQGEAVNQSAQVTLGSPAEKEAQGKQPAAHSEQQARQANADLVAQETMADASVWMAVAAWLTFLVTLGGTILIWRTLIATRDAVRTQIKAERPHVRLHRTEKTKHPSGSVKAINGVTFRNYGRTPALIKSLSIAYELRETPPLPSEAGAPRVYPDDMVMVAGEEWPRKHYIPPLDGKPTLDSLCRELGNDTRRLFVFGEMVYTDAFGESRKTGFCRVWDGQNFVYNQTDIGGDKRLNYTT